MTQHTPQDSQELRKAIYKIVKESVPDIRSVKAGIFSGLEELIEAYVTTRVKEAELAAFKYGLLTGAMPEALGKPIAEDYITSLTATTNGKDNNYARN